MSDAEHKRQSRPELVVLLYMGVPPKVLIERGYSRSSVYAINRRMDRIRSDVVSFITSQIPHN